MCVVFALTVLVLTTIWVYLGRDLSFTTLANAMYFPAILSILFVDDRYQFLWQVLGTQQIFDGLVYSGVSVVIVYIIIYLCLFLDLSLGWATKAPDKNESIHGHNKSYISGFLRAAGEEMGWRCYLLPCLMSQFSPVAAFAISGVVWGLFHVPVMILLSQKLRPKNPITTITVQSVSCALVAFPIGWVSLKSGYSMWPATIMHWWWNRLNPTVLGSIYTNTPGQYEGVQWKINGEGLAGCLIMVPIALLVIYNL